MPIAVQVEVSKVDKNRFYQDQKRGKVLDLILIETPNSKYNDYLVKQSQTKEERERGEKGVIIGSAKILRGKGGSGPKQSASQGSGDDEW